MSDQIAELERTLELAEKQHKALNEELSTETSVGKKQVLVKVIFSSARLIADLEDRLEKAREEVSDG